MSWKEPDLDAMEADLVAQEDIQGEAITKDLNCKLTEQEGARSLFQTLEVSTKRVQDVQHLAIEARLNGRTMLPCLDTGAGKNYVAAESLTPNEVRKIRRSREEPPTHAGGGKMRISGVLSMNLDIGRGHYGKQEFRVAKGLPVEAILGNAFARKHVDGIYPKSGYVKLDQGGGLVRTQVKKTGILNPLIESPLKVRAVGRHTLPPESFTAITVELDRAVDIPVLIRRDVKAFVKHGILPSQMIVPGGTKKTTLIIGNFDRMKVDIFPRQSVGECEVEDVDQYETVAVLSEDGAMRGGNAEQEEDEDAKHLAEAKEALREKTKHLSKEQQKKMTDMLEEFAPTVFGRKLGRTAVVEHEIITNGKGPVAAPSYRLGPKQEEFARTESIRMLKDGLLSHSKSPWSAPIIIAKKPKGGFRYCTDFRAVNEITKRDSYPMPRSEVLLDRLGGASYFSTLDAERGFFQVEVRKQDREKTAFATPIGLLQYNVMPMGMTNAPPCFQRLMDIVLRGLHKTAVCFLDDVLCFTSTFEEHVKELRTVLARIENAGLTLNLKKCCFAVDAVEFLGHKVSKDGIQPTLRKTEAVEKLAVPRDVSAVRQFLGLTGWFRRFIKDYARRTRSLARLTKKNEPFVWTADHQREFEDLKSALCSRPVLKIPEYDKPFVLDTDASKHQIGGVLMQNEGEEGARKAVAYLSRTLHGAEVNYTVTEKEALAAVWCLKKVRHIIGDQQVTVVTDHAALRYLKKTTKDPYGRLARWSLALQDYNVVFVTRAGKKHLAGDAMSRLTVEREENEEGNDVNEEVIFSIMEAVQSDIEWGYGLPSLKKFQEEQKNDREVRAIKEFIKKGKPIKDKALRDYMRTREQDFVVGEDGLLKRMVTQGTKSWRQTLVQAYVPKTLKKEVMQYYHQTPVHGHLGIERTYLRIRDLWYWKGMQNDVAMYVSRCPECIKSKTVAPKRPVIDLKSIRASKPGEIVAMDLLGGLPQSWGGKSYVMVVSDLFTKYARFVSLPAIDTVTVADALLKEWILIFGPPEKLLSDRGVQFTSELFVQLMRALEIKKIFTTAYHPQTDGQVERLNKTLINILRTNMDEYQKGWEDALPMAEYAYNTSIHASTGETPYRLTFKQNPPPFTTTESLIKVVHELKEKSQDQKDHRRWAEDVLRRFKKVYEGVQSRLEKSRNTQGKYYNYRVDPIEYEVGDLVYVFHPAVKTGRTKKLSQPWRGPFKITARPTKENVELGPVDEAAKQFQMRSHVNRLKKCPEGTLELYPLTKEGREEQLEEGFQIIEKIAADRHTKNGREFRIVWEGIKERTWEPEENLPPAAVRDYLRTKSARATSRRQERKRRKKQGK